MAERSSGVAAPDAEAQQAAPAVLGRGRPALFGAILVAVHLVGAAVAATLLLVVLPLPAHVVRTTALSGQTIVVLAGYLLVVVPAIVLAFRRWLRPVRRAIERHHFDSHSRRRALAFPQLLLWTYALAWLGGAALFAGLNLRRGGLLAGEVLTTVALAGAGTSAMAYLIAARLVRPYVALVLDGRPARSGERSPGLAWRSVVIWALGTGAPAAGIVAVSGFGLAIGASARRLAVTDVVLGGVVLLVGAASTSLVARGIGRPLRILRTATEAVAAGDLTASVEVDDAYEMGRLQAGFNTMVAGLAERERLRDLYRRQVGQQVADASLRHGIHLGGEQRDVGVMFVDVIGSTGIAERTEPSEVVDMLNRFFALVVEAAAANGGWVNKFEGDGALCVFGAPDDAPDPAGSALAAARHLAGRLATATPGIDAAIGVGYGPVVAGHVGAFDRFEYTVIGDPVNQAARLTELAKQQPGRVLATCPTLEAADSAEARQWMPIGPVTLRGRQEPTELAAPRSDAAGPG